MFKLDLWKLSLSFFSFLKQLLIAHWRSLLLLLLGVYLPLQVFEQLAVEIWQHQGGFPWDVPILLAIHATSQVRLDAFVVTLTKFGVYWGVVPVTAAIACGLLLRRWWRSLTYLLATMLGSAVINRTAKELLHRMRPDLWHSPVPELDYGFPSGHAMSSMSLVTALVILTWGSPWCWLILLVGGAFVVAIGWTRLYLGVHFPSDVLAGWLVSLAWAIGVSLIVRPQMKQAIAEKEEEPVAETTLLPQEAQSVSQD